jgi:hypothetical protein
MYSFAIGGIGTNVSYYLGANKGVTFNHTGQVFIGDLSYRVGWERAVAWSSTSNHSNTSYIYVQNKDGSFLKYLENSNTIAGDGTYPNTEYMYVIVHQNKSASFYLQASTTSDPTTGYISSTTVNTIYSTEGAQCEATVGVGDGYYENCGVGVKSSMFITDFGSLVSSTFTAAIMGSPFGFYNLPTGIKNFTWESAPIYAANLSAWTNTDVSYMGDNIGNSISTTTFNIRFGSSLSNLATASYTKLTTDISAVSTTTAFAQLQVNTTDIVLSTQPVDRQYTSNLDIKWKYGTINIGAFPHAMIYNNKYYLAIASNNATSNNLLLKYSLHPTEHWSLYDFSCSALLNFLNSPKCAIAGSMGNVFTMDKGNSDSGMYINTEYQSGDQLENAPYYPKYIQYILLDFIDNSTGFTFGISYDKGSTWTDYNVVGTGSGERIVRRYNIQPTPALQYRVRVKSSANIPMVVNGIDIIGYTRSIMEQ